MTMIDFSRSAVAQYAARQFQSKRRWATPGELAAQLDPRTRPTPALDLIDNALVSIFDKPDGRLIVSMPPQEGKSTRGAKDFPIWALTQDRSLRIITASYDQGLANRNGRSIRNAISENSNLLGMSIARDNGAVHEWTLAGREGGVLSVGIGAGVTGRPADLLIIDDPIKNRKEADSQTFRQNVWEWWTDSASTRLAPGAPVVLILTRWHEDDLAGRLIDGQEHWDVINIPAQADHNPAKGETDPLDRQPGEYMVSARDHGSKRRNWDAIKIRVGSRTWASLYQGRPSPAAGGILKRGWWREYDTPMAIENELGQMIALDADAFLIQSWDLAFKDKSTSDYVCGQVWLRRGPRAYLLDQVHGRFDFPETIKQFRRLTEKWPQAVLKIVEDAANGPAVISSLSGSIPGIVPESVHDSKTARAEAVSPVIEAGNVWLPAPELAPWVGDLIEEAAAFPNAVHDDRVDALTQALHRLLIQPLVTGTDDLIDADDLYSDVDDYSISPY